jgi:hypothetical protein
MPPFKPGVVVKKATIVGALRNQRLFPSTRPAHQAEEVVDIAQQDLAFLTHTVERAVDVTARDLSEFAEIVKRVSGV